MASGGADRGAAPRRIAILGFGLIGGSIARAVRGMDGVRPRLVAWSPSGRGPAAALADGVVDDVGDSAEAALVDADLVVVAAPPLDAIALVESLSGPLRARLGRGATVTDVTSTKAEIVRAADRGGLRFVGGHPMAGRETTGYGTSDERLFEGRPWVIVRGAAAGEVDVARVTWLALACRARPVALDAQAHDEAAAAISHLPLVVSAALVESVAGSGRSAAGGGDWELASSLAASGWRDMTRLARGDPAMGAGILATNAMPVAARLRALRAAIDSWITDLERSPRPATGDLQARLGEIRERLR